MCGAALSDWNAMGARGSPLTPHAKFVDETLRDGLQNPSVTDPTAEQKLELVEHMVALGIDHVNVGLPVSSPRNREHAEALCRAIARQRLPILPIAAGRTVVGDLVPIVEIAQRTGIAPAAYAFLGGSEIRCWVENWRTDTLVQRTRDAVAFATGEGLEVCFVTEDTTRAHPGTLRALWTAALDAGAHRLCLADTVGHATSSGVRNLVLFARTVTTECGRPEVGLEWHGHNDRGLALDNALWAIEYGVERIHATALGVGERTGNTCMELLLLNLWLSGVRPLPDPSALDRYAECASRITCWPGRAPSSQRTAAEWATLLPCK